MSTMIQYVLYLAILVFLAIPLGAYMTATRHLPVW